MNLIGTLFVVGALVELVAGLSSITKVLEHYTRPLPLPQVNDNKYWGPGSGEHYQPNNNIVAFAVQPCPQEILQLQSQLSNQSVKLTPPLEGIDFEYGFNTADLAEIVQYWRDDYLPRWTERLNYLNSLPQYTTEIQGLRIHYIHAQPSPAASSNHKVIPLLVLHGWPGSVRELYEFIPLLTNSTADSNYVFEVIAPSLVGFGWSQAATKPGFNPAEMATVMRNLMLRVGHNKFLIQGGDWGSIIGSYIATLYPQNVLGYHSNFCSLNTPLSLTKLLIASFSPDKFLPTLADYPFHFPIGEKVELLLQESGYYHLQATKPDTIGAVLSNNPAGLAAYILEKFQTSTAPDQQQKFDTLAKVYTLDALLDNLMIYYLSNTATSSARLYKESVTTEFRALQLDRVPSAVPMGCARFKYDLPTALDWQLKDKFPNLMHSSYIQQGGHFAALELPSVLYEDFQQFVSKLVFSDV